MTEDKKTNNKPYDASYQSMDDIPQAKGKKDPFATKSWREIDRAGIIKDGGNSILYKTGNWTNKKLNFDPEKCINCNLCWPVCPDNCILVDKDGNMKGVDLEHCKDCGFCVEACPTKCLFFTDEKNKEI